MMRVAALTAATLALAACDLPGGSGGGTDSAPAPDLVDNLILVPGGMQQPGNDAVIAFGADRPNILQLMVQITGDTPEGGTNTECGAGPVQFSGFLDEVTLNFQSDSFAGWTTTDPTVPVAGGLRPGMAAPPPTDVTYTITTLGTEFAQGDGIFGILTDDGSEIAMMWAGTTCFFR